jgi:hypothetical protein
MRKFNRADFIKAVENKEIKNGTEFKVFKGTIELGIIAVQRTMIVYVAMPVIPNNLLISDEYEFVQIEEDAE